MKSDNPSTSKLKPAGNRVLQEAGRKFRAEGAALGQSAVGAATAVVVASVGVAAEPQILEAAVEVLLGECACW